MTQLLQELTHNPNQLLNWIIRPWRITTHWQANIDILLRMCRIIDIWQLCIASHAIVPTSRSLNTVADAAVGVGGHIIGI